MTTRTERIETRNLVAETLQAFGMTKELFLGEGSEMSYIFTESANGAMNIVLTTDFGMDDIFEGQTIPYFETELMSREFQSEKFLTYRIIFE